MRLLAHKSEPLLLLKFSHIEFMMNSHRVQDWLRAISTGEITRQALQDMGVAEVKFHDGDLLIHFFDKEKLIAWVKDRWIYEMSA